MKTAFHKMHGLGNDFVVIDARAHDVAMSPERATAIANRRTGIGCDQVILLQSSSVATVRMRIFNADGSEVEACGNAARCVALFLGSNATIETMAGLLGATPSDTSATVTMGHPAFDWQSIPLAMPMDTRDMPVSWDSLTHPAAVNVGNPHIVIFVDNCDDIDLATLGPRIENDPLFPDRTNVNIATVTGPRSIKLRVWERGVGLTLACGTGACATAVVAIRRKSVVSPVKVSLPGGDLTIDWASGMPIRMSGAATHVFSGQVDWAMFG